jgi:hypothetical protein
MKYNENQQVKHTTTGKRGTVVRCINANDKVDVREQGYRYEVLISGWLWSIPEQYLLGKGYRADQ